MSQVKIVKLGWVLSIFFSLVFVVCFFWIFVLRGDLYQHYLDCLKVAYLAFSGINLASFIAGLVQTFIWGWIVALVFGWLWNQFHKQ